MTEIVVVTEAANHELHGRTGVAGFGLLARRLPVPREFHRSPTDEVESLRNLAFARGARYCLHVPGIRNALTLGFTIATCLDRELTPVHVASLPEPESWLRRRFLPVKPAAWLAAKTGLTINEAASRIADLPMPIPDRFSCMAYNPRRFLSFLAAMHGDPRVLVYETAGMDPLGMSLLHSFAKSQYTTGALVHRCSTPLDGCKLDPDCKLIEW